MSLTNQEIRLAVYQTYVRNSGDTRFDTDYGDQVSNWIIDGKVAAAPVAPTKPVVRYDATRFVSIEVGRQANVFAMDHPRLGAQPVVTSTVLKSDVKTGEFETRNTIYVRA